MTYALTMHNLGSRLVDLTHSLSPEIPCWDGDCGFSLTIETDYKDCTGPDRFRTQKIETRAGMGTHIDAPAHCFQGAKTIDALDLKDLVTDCAVIKVHDIADENYIITPEVLKEFEKKNGIIQTNTFVIFHTGWDKHWSTEKYRNSLRFPSVHEETAKLLLQRNISGLGTDTLSADARGESFPVHRCILGAGKYLVENIVNARELPSTGAKIFIMPTKIKGGTEAPIRLVASI